MKQAKKIFTKILLNNWGGVDHRVLELNEYVNLFSGKSGSGKSTVMDAIQVILYGSLKPTFLNKAADDAKNRRSVLSYLRGDQKDGSVNRANQDFCSQIVLEIKDIGNNLYTCIGATFEVGRHDQDVKKEFFFSHVGEIPEDKYFMDNGSPYTIEYLRAFINAKNGSKERRIKGDINRVYPTHDSYKSMLYNVILGYIDGARFKTMEKSAIALKMTNGTGQFIRDYMFPKSSEDTVEKISEQLGAYRDIRAEIEDLEKRIYLLTEVREKHRKMTASESDILKNKKLLTCLDVEIVNRKLEFYQQEFDLLSDGIDDLDVQLVDLTNQRKKKLDELTEIMAELKGGDYGKTKEMLEATGENLKIYSNSSTEWRRIVADIRKWEQAEYITDYISNSTLQLMETFRKGKLTKERHLDLKARLEDSAREIDNRLDDELVPESKRIGNELKEKQENLTELKQNRKPYNLKGLKDARGQLEKRLQSRYGRRIKVHIFADLFDIKDEMWKNAIEGRLGRIKYHLITEPQYAHEAAVAFRQMKGFEEVQLINSKAIEQDQPRAEKNSLYDAIAVPEEFVFAEVVLKRYLGRIIKCYSIEDLEQARDGVTADCYSYSNYIYRHLRKRDYLDNACIGTTISKKQIQSLEEEVEQLRIRHGSLICECNALKAHHNMEKLNQESEQLITLSESEHNLKIQMRKKDKLERELQELESGERVMILKEQEAQTHEAVDRLDTDIQDKDRKKSGMVAKRGGLDTDIKRNREYQSQLLDGYITNEELEREVREGLDKQSESAYKNAINVRLAALQGQLNREVEARYLARKKLNDEYKSLDLNELDSSNDAYDMLLDKYQNDYEPRYKQEFQEKYNQVYLSLRDNVIATIHANLKEAKRHQRDINRMLAGVHFSDSVYQIELVPAENENGQFYEMLMARELDNKTVNTSGYEGQISFGDDEFMIKYQDKIKLLTEKFMPPHSEDQQAKLLKRQEMEQYADYRNYLTFNMYERVIDEHGNEKRNAVDEMAGRDSGGEGQNPKYVALLAGFAMLYMQQSNRDSRIKLVLLDEAFSKMDKERSEVCLRYARDLQLQLIVCVPDERLASLVRNVDCVYGFRRHQNKISMMHIDKGNYLQMLEGSDEPEDATKL